ncbi:YecA family protein [Superficieibacter sp.]|uniref:YecA/YgfB family protein n=1 Tax=Superficieibacter sp. TaxID=2303322 RepID=UPI0028ABAC41|nr:YecA family protein [Superficieibacter sp.]
MNTGPLNEKELEWLDDVFMKYGNDDSVLDAAELDGLLTAVLSAPHEIEPTDWLLAIWGGAHNVPEWASEREMERFMALCFQHMGDIADRLELYPEQFEPLFGTREVEGQEFTIVEEWCFGYMRGVALADWSSLPESLQPALDAIALHGLEANFDKLDLLSPEEHSESIDLIAPAALSLYTYWSENPVAAPLKPVAQPLRVEKTVGRNDPCPCGSGKKFKQCCLH